MKSHQVRRSSDLYVSWSSALSKASRRNLKSPPSFRTPAMSTSKQMDGDAMRPGLFSEDRQAISNVEGQHSRLEAVCAYHRSRRRGPCVCGAQRAPGRCSTACRRLRKPTYAARAAKSKSKSAMQFPNQYPGQGGNSTEIGVRGEAGPETDLLRVFSLTPDGKLVGPSLCDRANWMAGSTAPSVLLMKQLKSASRPRLSHCAARAEIRPVN